MKGNFIGIMERIKENKFKTPIEKTKIYADRGYNFCGCFEGGIKGTKKFACADCGFSQTIYLMRNIEEIYVCGRCNGTNIKAMTIKQVDKLNIKFSKALMN